MIKRYSKIKSYIIDELDFLLNLLDNIDESSGNISKLPLTLFQEKFTEVGRRSWISRRCHFYGSQMLAHFHVSG